MEGEREVVNSLNGSRSTADLDVRREEKRLFEGKHWFVPMKELIKLGLH